MRHVGMQDDISVIARILRELLPEWLYVKLRTLYRYIRERKLRRPLSNRFGTAPRVIVTLTSYGSRLNESLPLVLESLFCQTELPDQIVLWLAEGTAIPESIHMWVRRGLKVEFCEDLRSYKKLIPALQRFPNDILVTADDDIFYPPTWLGQLLKSYRMNPHVIHCHRAHEILLDEDGNMLPYMDWNHCPEAIEKPCRIFPTTGGGVLYPPKGGSLDTRCLDKALFTELAPYADDVWFWAMGLLGGVQYSLIPNGHHGIHELENSQPGLFALMNSLGGNDLSLQRLNAHFPEIMDIVRGTDGVKPL